MEKDRFAELILWNNYDLDKIAGWIDGMIPLILVVVVMLGIVLAIVKQMK